MKPSFVTGANAKIKAGGITLAYAQDVSYNVEVTHIPIETMGRYEVVSNEPIAYFVNGTLSVIRYTSVAKTNSMDKVASNGNAPARWNFTTPSGTDGMDHLNPSLILTSQTFDIEVFQKIKQNSTAATDNILVAKLIDSRFTRLGGAVNKRGVLVEQFAFNAILADQGSDASEQASRSGDDDLA